MKDNFDDVLVTGCAAHKIMADYLRSNAVKDRNAMREFHFVSFPVCLRNSTLLTGFASKIEDFQAIIFARAHRRESFLISILKRPLWISESWFQGQTDAVFVCTTNSSHRTLCSVQTMQESQELYHKFTFLRATERKPSYVIFPDSIAQ